MHCTKAWQRAGCGRKCIPTHCASLALKQGMMVRWGLQSIWHHVIPSTKVLQIRQWLCFYIYFKVHHSKTTSNMSSSIIPSEIMGKLVRITFMSNMSNWLDQYANMPMFIMLCAFLPRVLVMSQIWWTKKSRCGEELARHWTDKSTIFSSLLWCNPSHMLQGEMCFSCAQTILPVGLDL